MNNGKKLPFEERLEKEFKDLPEGWIILLETGAEDALKISLAAIKILTNKNYNGIILSASRPCSNLFNVYEKNNIDIKKIFIIDCICKTQNSGIKDSENVIYLAAASALTNIAIAISKAIEKIKGNKFIFIDSITTMLIHNKPDVFARFTHSILTKMRMNGVGGILICLENETNKEVRAEIAQLCDKVIKIGSRMQA